MSLHTATQFKAEALTDTDLHAQAPSIFAEGPMAGLSARYTFVPTARIVGSLREHGWVPVAVEEQRIRKEARRGFQKHLIRLRRAEQMTSLDEWNMELVLLNSHDAGCAYQVHAGIYRRICSNGLVMSSDEFQAIRFRHTGSPVEEVVQASFRLLDCLPRVGEMVHRFRERVLDVRESLSLARHALLLRYPSLEDAPVDAETLLKAQRPEDEGVDLWRTTNRLHESLVRGGVSDGRLDLHGRVRSVRALRGIDSKVSLNQCLWSLAERLANGEALPPLPETALPA